MRLVYPTYSKGSDFFQQTSKIYRPSFHRSPRGRETSNTLFTGPNRCIDGSNGGSTHRRFGITVTHDSESTDRPQSKRFWQTLLLPSWHLSTLTVPAASPALLAGWRPPYLSLRPYDCHMTRDPTAASIEGMLHYNFEPI